MNELQDLSQIAGTLRYGNFSGENRKYIIIAFVIYTLIFVGGMIALLTALCLEQSKSSGSYISFVCTLIIIIIGFSSTPILWLIIIIKNERNRKEILLWLKDAVKLKAFSKKVGEFKASILFPTVKIQVDFEFDGIYHSCESKGKQIGGMKEGYHRIWTQFIDKPIEILYSPKYDEVMLLKSSHIKIK